MSTTTNLPPIPDVPSDPLRAPLPFGRKRLFIGIACACAASAVIIVSAMKFQRPPPVQPPHAGGFDVLSETSVAVAAGSPQWKVLKLGKVEKAVGGWTDPIPGRIKIDEHISSKVGSPLAGRVLEVLVEVGAHVKTGDPLFRISSPDLAELRSQKQKADVDLDAARVVMERTSAMVEAHALALKDEQLAAQTLKQAELTRDTSIAKLKALGLAVDGDRVTDSFTVTSPQDGIVVEKNLTSHQSVAPDASNPLLVVADLSSVWVVADLFEADATDIREGVKAEVTQARASSGPIEATVDTVSAIVDPNRHTVPIRVRVPNPDNRLRPNAFATVRFATTSDGTALSVPSTSVLSDGAKQYVYIYGDDKRFNRRDVVVGSNAGGNAIVLKGLREGETVLIEGGILLDNQIHLDGQS